MLRNAAFAVLLFLTSFASGDSLKPISIAHGVRFDQNLDAQIPLDLPFVSDSGKPVRLGEYFHQRPVILVLDYNRCPNLCGIVLNSLVTSLQNLTFDAGDRFEVVVVSIDPTDTPRASELEKLGYADRYERPKTAHAWHFLTGTQASIKALADTVGFHYVYDAASRQYAHPSGMMVVTPDGKISRYFFGIEFPPREIRDALAVAAQAKINSPVYDLLLLCCQYNPLQGTYGVVIFDALRFTGFLAVLALAGYVFRSLRSEFRRRGKEQTLPP